MNRKRLWMILLVAGSFGVIQAQQSEVKMVADGHYQGARLGLASYLTEADGYLNESDAEALMLVCDYVLGVAGTVDRMGEWVEENPLSQYANVLAVMRRNLLIKEGRTDEALELFFASESGDGDGVQIPLAYPLTRLSDEMNCYNPVLYRLAGERLYDQGNYTKAMVYLEAGEKTRTAQYKLGMSYYRSGLFDKACPMLVTSAGSEQDEMAQSAWLYAGMAALQQKQKTEAQKCFNTASQMTVNPQLREQALYDYALTLHEQQSPQTVAVMEQFLTDFPSSQHAKAVSQCLTEVYMTKKDYTKALSAISKVQMPDADTQADKQKVLYNLAFQQLSGGNAAQALAYAGQAIMLGNQDAEAYAESYYILGDCHYRMGNYQQAANDLNTALNLGLRTPNGALRNNAYAVYTLAYSQFKMQKYNAAIAQFQKIDALADATAAMKADAWNRIGDSYLSMRNYDVAVNCYERAKATDHALGDYAMLQQAYIEGLRGNYDRKVEIIQQMNSEYEGSNLAAQALYEQGRAYVLSGRNDEATLVFGSLVMKYPTSEYAIKAGEELQTMAANRAMQDSIAAVQDSIDNAVAKAPVMAAQALLKAGKAQQAEQEINAAIDAGIGKPYWLARAFVLLSDIYRAEGRETEAVQTLESLKANYKEQDDIQTMIEERLKR